MAQSSHDADIDRRISEVIGQFETGGNWRLTESAKTVIREAVYSLKIDQIGIANLNNESSRLIAQNISINRWTPFLYKLQEKANDYKTPRSGGGRLIGAIFVMQNIRYWPTAECHCWPTDE